MRELIMTWRAESTRLALESMADGYRAQVLAACADQLEQAWHDLAHDGEEWVADGLCSLCDRERGIEPALQLHPVILADELPG